MTHSVFGGTNNGTASVRSSGGCHGSVPAHILLTLTNDAGFDAHGGRCASPAVRAPLPQQPIDFSLGKQRGNRPHSLGRGEGAR